MVILIVVVLVVVVVVVVVAAAAAIVVIQNYESRRITTIGRTNNVRRAIALLHWNWDIIIRLRQ